MWRIYGAGGDDRDYYYGRKRGINKMRENAKKCR